MTTGAGQARRARPVVHAVKLVTRVAPGVKPTLQKQLIRLGYRLVNRQAFATDSGCLNYGYATEDDHADTAARPDHYGLRLYEHVAGAVDLRGARVLEVGCGRGGGAAHLSAVMGPAEYTGVDFAESAIAWCRRRHERPGLRFLRADAERLPFPDGSFDAVINVESSHCYPDVGRFLREVRRVLTSSGALLLADLRPKADVDELRRAVRDAGFAVREDEVITAQVVRALDRDSARRAAAVERGVPRPLRPAARDFVATRGSEVFELLRRGELEYVRLTLTPA